MRYYVNVHVKYLHFMLCLLRMCWKTRVEFLSSKTINVTLVHLEDKITLLHYTVPRVKLVSSSSSSDNYRISFYFFYHTFLTRSESNSLVSCLNFPDPWLAFSSLVGISFAFCHTSHYSKREYFDTYRPPNFPLIGVWVRAGCFTLFQTEDYSLNYTRPVMITHATGSSNSSATTKTSLLLSEILFILPPVSAKLATFS
jgi:hypothetical protein